MRWNKGNRGTKQRRQKQNKGMEIKGLKQQTQTIPTQLSYLSIIGDALC